jgi:hypothetical protein
MKRTQFNDEISDEELFGIFKETISDEDECWKTVHEAQHAYSELKREFILEEIRRERDERNNDPYHY